MSFFGGIADLALSAYDYAEPAIDAVAEYATEGATAIGDFAGDLFTIEGGGGLFDDLLGIFDQASGGGASGDALAGIAEGASDLGSIAPRIGTDLSTSILTGGAEAVKPDGGLLSKFIESPADRAAVGTAAKYLLGSQLAKARGDQRIKEIQESKKHQGAFYVPANLSALKRRS